MGPAGVTQQELALAKDLVEAQKAVEERHLDGIKVFDSGRGAPAQIIAEDVPPDPQAIIETVVEKIGTIVRPLGDTGWQESQPSDRDVLRHLHLVLKDSGLPPQGEIFGRAYANIRGQY